MARKRTLAEKALNASLTPPEMDIRRRRDDYPTHGGVVGKKIRAGRGSRGAKPPQPPTESKDRPAPRLPAPKKSRRGGRA